MRKKNKFRKKFLKKIRMLMIVLIVIGGVFGVKMVKAGVNDSSIKKNKVDGVYAVTKLDGVDRIFYLNMYTSNDRTSYCIEIGVDIDTYVYNSTYDFSVSKLSNSKIKYIKDISYFGYGYGSHNDYRYYMAAQELIWEYLNGIEVEWTNELSIDGKRINIDRYKNDILRLVADYNQGLDLRGYTEGMLVNIGDSYDITDVNNNLQYYDIISGEHIDASIFNKSIMVKFDTDYSGMDSIYLSRKKVYGYDSLLYYKDTSQKLISNGNIDERVKLTFDIRGMNATFLIVDKSGIKNNNQNNFEGINYEFLTKDGEFIGELIGSKFGKMSFEDVVYGNYCVRQVSSNEAYKLNDREYCFEFNGNGEVIYLEVEPVVYDLEILKLYGDDNQLVEEEGALFEIYNDDGSLYTSAVSDDEGLIKIKLPYGRYRVKQTGGKAGYNMASEFEIVAMGEDSFIGYTLVNDPVLIDLLVNTKDIDNNLIRDDNIYYKIFDVNRNKYIDNNGEVEFQNKDGKLLVSDGLKYGSYVLEVINKSINYEEVVEQLEFEVDSNSNFEVIDGGLCLKVDINYELVKGSIKVVADKEVFVSNDGSYYYEYVADKGAKFELVCREDILVNGEVVYKKGDKVLDIEVDEEGEYLISDIYIGKYWIVSEDGDRKEVEIKNKDVIEVGFKKEIKKGEVIIHNVSDKLEDVGDSVIEIYDKDNKLVFIGITNDNGVIHVKDLLYGDYCFRQKSVDKKYKLNDGEVCFSINSGDGIELEIINQLIRDKVVEVPNTFNDKVSINRLVVIILILVGVILCVVRKIIK